MPPGIYSNTIRVVNPKLSFGYQSVAIELKLVMIDNNQYSGASLWD